MYRLIEFIRRSYVTLLFVILEIAAVGVYMHSTPYTRANLLSKVYSVVGWMSKARADVVSYFSLSHENRQLIERLAQLEAEAAALREIAGEDLPAPEDYPYTCIAARVVSNSVSSSHNYMILNKGFNHGVLPESAIVAPSGAVAGYILRCSDNYSVAMPILSAEFRTIGKVESSDSRGTISWPGANSHEVELSNLSKYAAPEVGDRVVTAGSYYFAPDMPIGTIQSLAFDEVQQNYTAVVALDVDMSRLYNVLIVRDQGLDEMHRLEQSIYEQNIQQ